MAVSSQKFIDKIFRTAVEKAASDIHIVEGLPPLLRIDGELHKMQEYQPLTEKDTADICYSLLNPVQKEVFDAERELDLGYEIEGLSRYRVNLHWEKGHAGLVARRPRRPAPCDRRLLCHSVQILPARTHTQQRRY